MDIEICKKCLFWIDNNCIATGKECPYIKLDKITRGNKK